MVPWYYQLGNEVVGPVSREDLQRMVEEGEIPPDLPVREGTEGPWTAASQVEGLFREPAGPIDALALDESPGSVAVEGVEPPPVESARSRARSPLSLRPCTDCGEMVSQHAAACPNCGRSFRDMSLAVPYGGEHPVPVWVFFTLLALAFIVASPLGIHWAVNGVAHSALRDEGAASAIALLVAAIHTVSMLSCALLGGAVGAPRMAYWTGLLLGLFFGPLGLFVALAIDKRPQCPNCFSRLGGLARECPGCRARLTWTRGVRWY